MRLPRLLPPPRWSARLLLTLRPQDVGMFRFLLEGYDNAATFTVLDAHAAILKLGYSPREEGRVRRLLADIAQSLPLRVAPWPTDMPAGPETGEPETGVVPMRECLTPCHVARTAQG